MNRKYSFDEDFVKEVVEDYKSGRESTTSLSKKHGIDTRTITRLLHKAGLRLRTQYEACRIGFIHKRLGNGGRYKDRTHGYIFVKDHDHPRANGRGYVAEHVIAWEKANKTTVPAGCVIHHLNGIKDDNRLENLFVLKRGEHCNLAEPYRRRIRELEREIEHLKRK
jgi:hypothetical protein